MGRGHTQTMSDNNDSTFEPSSAEEAGLSPTPTSGLSAEGTATQELYSGLNDPNAAAMNDNGEAAQERQLSGEAPGSESSRDGGRLPATQSDVFEEGT